MRFGCLMLLAICPTCLAGPATFWDRIDHYDGDVATCRKYEDPKICDEVDHRIKSLASYQKKKTQNDEDEGAPIVIKYDEGKTLRILELANTDLPADWVVNVYPLDQHRHFVTVLGTPHIEQLQEDEEGEISPADKVPVIYSFVLNDTQVEREYSSQKDKKPMVPGWIISDTIESCKKYGKP